MQFDSAQLAAIEAGCSKRFAVITGGAGTGKTTIIKAIATSLIDKGYNVTLCAFAGKAAARLRQATGLPTSTIHRMLQYDGAGFRAEAFSDNTIIIVDEASMVSADLFAEIVERNPMRLILVGDPAQLPPVGRGQPFHDIIKLNPEIVHELTRCYRATEAVFKAATAIRNGQRPLEHDKTEGERWDIINTGNAATTQAELLKWVDADHIDFEQDIILVPRNGENDEAASTVRGLNRAIAQLFDRKENIIRETSWALRKGDRVINTKNFPLLDVWNGTTGTVHEIDIDGGIWVTLDEPAIDHARTKDEKNPVMTDKVLFGKTEKKSLQLAYALSTHKSQGSQYRRVIFVALMRDSFNLLDRSLIYTAITRTREQCVVVGEVAAFYAGINKRIEKRTVLQQLAAQQ
jgi:exodeoxyribonuclease V alpha subunit